MVRKDGVFYYRRVLPGPDRQQVAVSLGTRRSWEAQERARELDAAYERELARVQAMSAEGDTASVAAVLRAHLRKALADHLSPVEQDFAPRVLWPEGMLLDGVEQARRSLADRDVTLVRHVVEHLMREHALPRSALPAIEIGVLETDLRVYQEALRRVRGEVPLMLPPDDADDPDTIEGVTVVDGAPKRQSRAARAPAPSPQTPAAPLASALVEPHFIRREKTDRTRHQVMAQERTTLRLFREVCGDRPVNEYRRSDVTAFLAMLRRLPNNYGRSPKDRTRTVAEIVAEADSRGAPRLGEEWRGRMGLRISVA